MRYARVMFRSPEQKVRRYLSKTTLPIPVMVLTHRQLGGSSVVVEIDEYRRVGARVTGTTWHLIAETPVPGYGTIEDTGASSDVAPDAIATAMLSVLAEIGLEECGVDESGSLRPLPDYRYWDQYRERTLSATAFVVQMARGDIPHKRTLGVSASEVAYRRFGDMASEFPTLFQ